MTASTMKTVGFATVGLAALLLTGCETLNGPQAVANAEAQREECKAVVLNSAAESMALNRQDHRPVTDIKQAEATLELNRLRLQEPPALRHPIAPNESLTNKALRDC